MGPPSFYLLKDSPSDKLAKAIRDIVKGGRVIAPELITDAWMETDPVTAMMQRGSPVRKVFL